MDASSQKKIAAGIMKVGLSRVRINQTEEVEEALTREDIRELIKTGVIWSVQKKGTSKFASRKKLEQKRKGRMRGDGRRKGTKGARKNDKTKWIEKVRPLRKLLSDLKASGQISTEDYRTLYMRVKGGFFRNKNHIMYYIKENEMLKEGISKKQAREKLGRLSKKPAKRPEKKPKGTPITKKKAEKPKKSEKK